MYPTPIRSLVYVFLILGLLGVLAGGAPTNVGGFTFNDLCDYQCPRHYSPVCAVDSSGVSRTFPNRCLADLMYCFETRYYAIVKQGEC